MKYVRRMWMFLLVLNVLSATVVSGPPNIAAWIVSMKSLAYALGWLMMVLMGIKWIIADSPNERAEAKKGMIYVIIGLLVVRSACNLICLYCNNVETALSNPPSFNCDEATYGCAAC